MYIDAMVIYVAAHVVIVCVHAKGMAVLSAAVSSSRAVWAVGGLELGVCRLCF